MRGIAGGFAIIRTIALAGVFCIGLVASTAPAILAGTSGTWAVTGTMNTGRLAHSATLLQNGQVLVAGGINSADLAIASAEVFNPATGQWTVTGSMLTTRYSHAAVLLPDGTVLVAGGIVSNTKGATAEAEIYNPSTGRWTRIASMGTARSSAGVALLANGQVLVAGGINTTGQSLASAELYNPITGSWSFTGTMNFGRAVQAALLADGDVLMAGGGTSTRTAEIYSNGSWTLTSGMVFGHPTTKSAALANGDALAYGGTLASYVAEFFSPSTGVWTATHNLGISPPGGVTLTLLNTSNVLLVGGSVHSGTKYVPQKACHLYSPSGNNWLGTGSMNQARVSHTATLLPNGQVLAAGGGSTVLGSAEIYTP